MLNIAESRHYLIMRRTDIIKLAHLRTCKSKKRLLSLLNCKKIQLLIRELAKNLLAGKLTLNNRQKTYLRKKAVDIRKLAAKKTSHKARLAITNQRGGFLGGLIAPLLKAFAPTLMSLAGKIIR